MFWVNKQVGLDIIIFIYYYGIIRAVSSRRASPRSKEPSQKLLMYHSHIADIEGYVYFILLCSFCFEM